jgi:hypothetical protein
MEDPGLTILPTHRCVHDLPGFDAGWLLEQLEKDFDLISMPDDDALLGALRHGLADPNAPPMAQARLFGLVLPGDRPSVLLRLHDDAGTTALLHAADHPAVANVDVAALQTLVLSPLLGISPEPAEMKRTVAFTSSARQAIDDARTGRCQAAFLVNSTRLSQLTEVSQEGQVMPPKATYFYPKLPSGLVVSCVE